MSPVNVSSPTGLLGLLDVATGTLTMSAVHSPTQQRDSVLRFNLSFTTATGVSHIIFNIGGQEECRVTFDVVVSVLNNSSLIPQTWLQL